MKLLYKFTFTNSNIICFSEEVSNDIENVYNAEIYYVPNGIEHFINENELKEKSEDIPVILFISNYLKEKGIFDAIDTAKILKQKGEVFKLYLIGAPSRTISLDKLNSYISKLSLKEFVFLCGPKFKIDKTEYLLKSDIFIFPTHNEAFGNVVLEAMQAGLPVISTKEGSLPTIVDDGKTGFLVEKHNPAALAKKMEILIKDKELREKMGKAGRKKFLEKYTLDIFEKNIKNVFDEVLKDIKQQKKK